MLIINLMSRCNCHCVFCCVMDDIISSKDLDINYIKERIAQQPSDTIIDFFGGEPTLYPYFMEALSFARKRGNKCRIATNGRTFSNFDFAKSVMSLGIDQIRTSIYGHLAKLHDYHTSTPGSFFETMKGIENLLNLGAELFVNTVITSENINYLPEIINLLNEKGVRNIKFGSLTNSGHVLELVPNPDDVRFYLNVALQKAKEYGLNMAVEKSPICLSPDHYKIFAYEPDGFLYGKSENCSKCLVNKYCVGFPKEQLLKYGSNIVQPLIYIKNRQVADEEILVAGDHEFVSWDDNLKKFLTVIVKASGTCNLQCDYCYAARNFSKASMMSFEVIEALIKGFEDSNYEKLDFNWHGGEPLLAEKNFFKKAFELQKYYGITKHPENILNRIQTNGTLIDKSWIETFNCLDLDVGLSIDGPEVIHNLHRKFRSGRGSFNSTQRNILKLIDSKVPVELLCVISHESISYIDEIYSFFSNISSKFLEMVESVNFMPSYEVRPDSKELIPETITAEEYAKFMIELFDKWFIDDDTSFNIVFFEEIITVLLGGKPTLCHMKRGCNNFITIEPSGDVYPCDRFSGIQDFYLGNLLKDDINTILHSENRNKYFDAVLNHSSLCLNCEWFKLCQGGCFYESYAHTKKFGQPSFYCNGLKELYEHIDSVLLEHLDGYKRFIRGD
jgi:uncharacterized protein